MSNINIINNNSNVNSFNFAISNILREYERKETEDFHQIALQDNEEKRKQNFQDERLKRLIPSIHKNYVKWIIKNKFSNDENAFIESIPNFFKAFTENDKIICDDGVAGVTTSEKKKLGRQKRQLIMFSSQLLKLTGLNRSKIISNDCLKYYKDEMKKTDDFLNNFRLINADGKFCKLTNNENKQKQKLAQILKISKTMSQLAEGKKMTFSLITLTPPPIFHSNPLNSNDNFSCKTPQEALDKINSYWKSIRANLSKLELKFGEDIFGIQCIELMKTSTLHMHICLYHTEYDTVDIHNTVKEVMYRNNSFALRNEEKVNFDIKLNNGKARGATYCFKYITKTHTNYNDKNQDDNALKNMAGRYFYGCRGFNFFGLKGSITKFNFLQKTYIAYKQHFSKEILQCFKKADYYEFIRKYEKFFKNEYFNFEGSKTLLGVAFDKYAFEKSSSDNEIDVEKKKAIIDNLIKNQIVLIEKRQFCVFEKNYEDEFKNIDELDEQLDIDNIQFANIKKSFEKVKAKQQIYDDYKEEFLTATKSMNLERGEERQKLLFEKINDKLNSLFNINSKLYEEENELNEYFDNELQLFNIIQEKTSLHDYNIEEYDCDMIEIT